MSDELGDPIPIHPHHPQGTAMDHRVRVAAAVVWREGRILLTQRPPGGPLSLMWELPGGKIEAGETPENALVREIREELGVRAITMDVIAVDTHDYPHGLEVELVFVHCMLDSYDFTPSAAVHAARWVKPAAIDLETVLAGDRGFLESLAAGSR